MKTVSATEARVRFGELLRHVATERTPVMVERGGKPLAVVLSLDEYRRLQDLDSGVISGPDDVWTRLEAIQTELRQRRNGRPLRPADEIVREMREERVGQLLADLRGR